MHYISFFERPSRLGLEPSSRDGEEIHYSCLSPFALLFFALLFFALLFFALLLFSSGLFHTLKIKDFYVCTWNKMSDHVVRRSFSLSKDVNSQDNTCEANDVRS